MKFKFILSLFLLGSALSVYAQGYKDGIEYYKAGQHQKAKILLQRNLDKPDTDKSLTYYYLGLIALENGQKADAKKYFEAGMQSNAEDPYNYIGFGALSLMDGNKKDAEDYFKTARSKEKKDPKVYVAIARAYYMANPTMYAKEIAKNIAQAKKINKKDPEAYVFEGDMLAAEKKWGESAGYYEMAIMFDKDLSEAYVKYADTYFHINPKVAIEKLEALVAINPNSALAQRELAEKYYENDQWTKAAQAYGTYMKNPNHFAEDEERYAVLLYFGERYPESFDLASRVLQKNPDSFLMKRMQFLNKAALKDYEAAEKFAQGFFNSTDPNNKYSSNDYTTYGEVLKELGRVEESLAQYEKAVEINPEKTELLKDLSSAYGEAKDYEKSALYYQKFVDTGDYTTNDLYVLAGKYQNIIATATNDTIKNDAVQKANKYIDIVIERVPDDYRIYQRKARINMVAEGEKRTGLALPFYEQMLEVLNKDEANLTNNADAYKEAYSYIGAYYLQNGDKDKAKEYYNKYLELEPTNTALKEYIDKLK